MTVSPVEFSIRRGLSEMKARTVDGEHYRADALVYGVCRMFQGELEEILNEFATLIEEVKQGKHKDEIIPF